ncbi:tuftelin isoform X5 [Balaenoptera musculus]|uniref:Tuftelin isoform X5 n=1 Tax=Balaenoptera musculus TaxID=9771 RepID=A0A8B8XYV1_BALMU|nr:tuftelin isoform X5 [Balaenoptera musculus]
MNGTHSWCTLVDVHPEGQTAGSVDILRLTLQGELTGDELERIAQKAGRKTYAMVSGRSTGHSLASELVESNDGHEEIIKVYLKGKSGDKMIHEKNVNQLKSEVQYIQEARNCLQKLREDISRKLDGNPGDSLHQQEIQVVLEKPNGFSQGPLTPHSSPPKVDTYRDEDVESLRRTVQDLLVKLQEAERQHQSDRVDFEVTLSRYQREAEQNRVALQRAEDRVEQKEAEVGELQRCFVGMETEHQALLAKVREGETALEELRSKKVDCRAEQENGAKCDEYVMSHFRTSSSVCHVFAAPEFKSCDTVKGHCHPGAQGENCLPGSREFRDARPDGTPDRETSQSWQLQHPEPDQD